MKTLLLNQELKGFDGTPIPTDGGKVLTLKDVLLAYLSQGQLMGLTPVEQGLAYQVGLKLGTTASNVLLEQSEYDLLKKLCDNGKFKQGMEEKPVFSLVITQQGKIMVDAAETIAAKPKDKKKE